MAKSKICPICGMKNCKCDHTTKAVPALMGDPRPHRKVTSVFKGVVENRDGSSVAAEGMSAANYSMRKRSAPMKMRKDSGGGGYVEPKYKGDIEGGKGKGGYVGQPNAGVPSMYPKGSGYAGSPNAGPPSMYPKGSSGGKVTPTPTKPQPSGMIPMGPTPSSKLPPRAPSPEPKKKTTKMAKGTLSRMKNYAHATAAVESVRPRGTAGGVVSEGDPSRADSKSLKTRIVSYNANAAGGKGTGARKVSKAMPMPMSTPAMSSMASRPMPPKMPPKMPSPAPSMMRPNPATPMRPAMGGTSMSSMYKGKKMAKANGTNSSGGKGKEPYGPPTAWDKVKSGAKDVASGVGGIVGNAARAVNRSGSDYLDGKMKDMPPTLSNVGRLAAGFYSSIPTAAYRAVTGKPISNAKNGTKKMAKADSVGQGAYINGKPAHVTKRSK